MNKNRNQWRGNPEMSFSSKIHQKNAFGHLFKKKIVFIKILFTILYMEIFIFIKLMNKLQIWLELVIIVQIFIHKY